MAKTGMIILAAGSSTRLGEPKQLLLHKGKTLIEHVVCEAILAKIHPVVVITGFNAQKISDCIARFEIDTLYNEKWRQGMASGIVKGLSKISGTGMDAVFIAVCDQPFVSAALFLQMIKKKERTGKEIIACSYAGTTGVPALFGKNYFPALRMLTGLQGAKTILGINDSDVDTVLFENGRIDIDTPADYKNFISIS
jgi:molybdenum cofactor cytidylyltransferase